MDTYIILTNIVLQHIVLNDILSLGYPGKGIAPYAAPSQGFKIVCFLLLLLLGFFPMLSWGSSSGDVITICHL